MCNGLLYQRKYIEDNLNMRGANGTIQIVEICKISVPFYYTFRIIMRDTQLSNKKKRAQLIPTVQPANQ